MPGRPCDVWEQNVNINSCCVTVVHVMGRHCNILLYIGRTDPLIFSIVLSIKLVMLFAIPSFFQLGHTKEHHRVEAAAAVAMLRETTPLRSTA